MGYKNEQKLKHSSTVGEGLAFTTVCDWVFPPPQKGICKIVMVAIDIMWRLIFICNVNSTLEAPETFALIR